MAKKVHPLRLRLLSASRSSSDPVGQSTTSQQSPVPQSVASPSVPEVNKSARRRKSSVDKSDHPDG